MKKIFLPMLLAMLSLAASAQTVSFSVTTIPCHDDGVLTATVSGLTPPLDIAWTTHGTAGTTIMHSGVSSLTDALTSYSGGPVDVLVRESCCSTHAAEMRFGGAPPFIFSIFGTSVVCPALGSVSAYVSGGTSPYTYSWYDATTGVSAGTTNPASVPAGGYGVTITDAAGCTYGSMHGGDSSGRDSLAYVRALPAFTLTMANTTASCTNGTATVSGISSGAVPPISYLWSTGATTSGITGLMTGNYYVSVTDALGCVASNGTHVSQIPVMSVPTVATPATCLASDGAIIGFGAGGVPPYTYLWSNGATSSAQTGLSAGYYGVTATDANGCKGFGGGNVSVSTPITVTYSTTPSSCTSPTGTATLTIGGGTAPYTVTWLTTFLHTGTAITGLAAGNYSFIITDAVGCIQSGTVVVPPVHIIVGTFTATSATCISATGGLTVAPVGGTTPYTYLWSTGGTSASIAGVTGGTYHVRVTDNVGCSANLSGYVPVFSPVTLGIGTTLESCMFANDGTLTATPAGGTTPYTYSWTGGGTTATITGRHHGDYWVSVSDAAGCTARRYAPLGYDATANSCYCTIEGVIYDDVNGNCVQDVGEAGIPHVQVLCSGGIGYTYTDLSGYYSFKVPSGSYIITETVLTYYPLASCQSNYIPVTATASSGCVITVNFANSVATIHDMHVSVWNYNFAIPGNVYNMVTLITNDGTVDETAALATYKPDGQLHAPTFVPSAIYTGVPYNYTTGTAMPAIAPGHTESFLVDYHVPTDIPIGTAVHFKDTVVYAAPTSNWLADYSPWNNVNSFYTTVVGSYDPNFKEVSPKGTGAAGIITYSDTILEYMVHFQNTGTYYAQKVVVIDTLDDNLDWTTLRPVYQSAQCVVNVYAAGTKKVASFTFDHINLPSQSMDDLRSNGMFTYTIETRRGLPLGTTFQNSASIYFDYNEPVKTNTTLNTIGKPTVGIADANATFSDGNFSIFPNPASQAFTAQITSEAGGEASMNVSDITGKVVMTQTLHLEKGMQHIKADVGTLAAGIYLVTLSENSTTQTRKLVVMK